MADIDLAKDRRSNVIHRHALLNNGKPAFCRAAGGKVIYPTLEAAIAAGVELLALGSVPQNAYACPKKPGHYHLHRDAPPKARRERRTR